MKRQAMARRLWLDTAIPFSSRVILYGGLAIFAAAMLLSLVAGEWDSVTILLCSLPLDFALLRIAFAAARAARAAHMRRRHFPSLLEAALAAHGETGADIVCDAFPDIPICVSRTRLYCAGEKHVHVQPLEELAWVYGESFRGFPWHQIVIWSRDASAQVAPLRMHHMAVALERLSAAAPWLPVGYNEAMRDSWNADHRDLMALIDAHRQTRRPFRPPWAGSGIARVILRTRNTVIERNLDAREEREQKKLTGRWDASSG